MVPMFGTQSVTFWYPTSFPIPYYSTTSQPLPTPIPNPKREGGREGRERAPLRDHRVSPATTSPVRRTSCRRTDHQRRSASAPRVTPPLLRRRPICEKQLTTTPLYVGDSYSVGDFVHNATVILWDKVALSAYSESAS